MCGCSRCSSFEEASLLLEELRLFDNQVYGVAHGLLMGNNDNTWSQALLLFDEVKRMDSSTTSAFYNALTDVLWHFGQVIYLLSQILSTQNGEAWLENITMRFDVKLLYNIKYSYSFDHRTIFGVFEVLFILSYLKSYFSFSLIKSFKFKPNTTLLKYDQLDVLHFQLQ